MVHSSDTIAAISTPPGPGGIAIIRFSGADALSIGRQLFISSTGTPCPFTPRHMHYGYIADALGRRLDEVLAVYMPGPHSATGEDVFEIHCHGGPAIATAILEAALTVGARLAEAGEFTRRAFLSGRIDLAQAEAVAEAIAAPTREGVRLAQAKMSGALSQLVHELRTVVDTLRVSFAAALDFPEDEDEIVPVEPLLEQIDFVKESLEKAIGGYERAKLWRDGASFVLAGQVNAGKSSLLNALLGRERAIVSDQPGTTRDYIEETLLIGGMPLRCIDTAGLRLSTDTVEVEGIRRAGQLAHEATVIVLVVDALDSTVTAEGFAPASPEMSFLADRREQLERGQVIMVVNKADVAPREAEQLATTLRNVYLCPVCIVSAKESAGLDVLSESIAEVVLKTGATVESDIAPNLRQTVLLKNALVEMEQLREEILLHLPLDILSLRLDAVAQSLDEVVGVSTTDAILGTIFSSFCIGK